MYMYMYMYNKVDGSSKNGTIFMFNNINFVYRITSNLTDVSNYSDSVMDYFLTSNRSYMSITSNISRSNYTDSSEIIIFFCPLN